MRLFVLRQIQLAQGHALNANAMNSMFEQPLMVLYEVGDKVDSAQSAMQLDRLLIEELHQPEHGCALIAGAIPPCSGVALVLHNKQIDRGCVTVEVRSL